MPARVQIDGLREFHSALKAMGPDWSRALRDAHYDIATLGARDSRSAARGMGGVQRKAMSAIGAKATQNSAAVAVMPSGVDRMGNVAFWGAKRHTGWYAARRYSDSPRQHPVWVGNSWEAAVAGQGPYAINNALARNLNHYLDRFLEMIDELAKRAFPEGKN